MSDENSQIDVKGDGRVVLYKRDGLKDPRYQVRIRIPNSTGYKRTSTKTSNLREAERFALDLFDELYIHVKMGGSLNSKTFKQVFDQWKKSSETMGSTVKGGNSLASIERVRVYALPYFGSMKIDTIAEKNFTKFWEHRKSKYNKRAPTNGTLKRERACILAMFRYAVSRGYLTSVPETTAPQTKLERRPTFTLDEWQTLYRAARKWVKEAESKATWRDRFVAQQYFLILANTGLRIGELRSLRWSDLRTVKTESGTRLIGEVHGKTGVREVVFQAGSEEYIRRLYDQRIKELDGVPEGDGSVFCHKDGKPIQTMKRSFHSLLKFAELPIERNGKPRTLYSLRHFYATQRLSNETSPFLLAKQMGTSVEMLEKFYGQTVGSLVAEQVSKGRQTSVGDREKDYPFD
ncbi:site-specific integrase [Amylibacter sp.]|nr:site-specific integrase [Amylibacter sp.]